MVEAIEINPWIFLLLAAMLFAAYITGQGLANTWRPALQVFLYCVLLGIADRFLVFALYQGELLSLTGYLVDTAVLMAVGLFAYRFTQARNMVSQYPWLYERAGFLRWREKR